MLDSPDNLTSQTTQSEQILLNNMVVLNHNISLLISRLDSVFDHRRDNSVINQLIEDINELSGVCSPMISETGEIAEGSTIVVAANEVIYNPPPQFEDDTNQNLDDNHSDHIISDNIVNDDDSVCESDAPEYKRLCAIINELSAQTLADDSFILEYEKHDSSPFHLFNMSELDLSTTYTHNFSNRSACYYGVNPYSYGGVTHKPQPYSENTYLTKLLNYAEIVYPNINFNSAMIHKYESGEFMPHHSDDETELMEGSSIITISFGESRVMEFQNKTSQLTTSITLDHGDGLIMSQESQKYYTHSIPPGEYEGTRLSVTLRLIKPTAARASLTSETSVDFINNVDESEKELNTGLCDGYQAPEPQIQINSSAGQSRNHSKPHMLHPSRRNNTALNKRPDRAFIKSVKKPVYNGNKVSVDTIYISSSMFRLLDAQKMCSNQQSAKVFFYPGADAKQMLQRLLRDPEFVALDKLKVHRVFLLTGTNNVEDICGRKSSLSYSADCISEIINYIWSVFSSSKIHIINILPRRSKELNIITNKLNSHIRSTCTQHGFIYVDTESTNHLFSDNNGFRKGKFYRYEDNQDNVHLNEDGIKRLASYLKYISHIGSDI